ncbi:MAG TPA: permease-like cell division protein FtsX [Candidatus Paceibacterota bacterium]|nr:permease-like cell division protein FtsX [Candidatus Paceibacterota bacterium]
MWTGFKRVVRSGFVGFWRNAFVSLAAVFVMTVTLFVISASMMLNQLLGVSLQNIQDRVDINVYFNTDAELIDINALQNELESLPEVRQVIFTSREDALEEFRARHRNDELTIQALEELGENPLGASLSVRTANTSQYDSVAAFLEEQTDVMSGGVSLIDRVNYNRNREAIARLTAIIEAVEQSTMVALVVLVIAAVLITFNTVRLAIYTAREEISVMRLVGASNMYIRGPFMLQGIMYGLIAGLLALLIMYPILLWIGPATESFFEFNLFTYFVNDFAEVFRVVVGTGVILGFISSTLAVSRYLRV